MDTYLPIFEQVRAANRSAFYSEPVDQAPELTTAELVQLAETSADMPQGIDAPITLRAWLLIAVFSLTLGTSLYFAAGGQ